MSKTFGQTIKIQRILKNLTQGEVVDQIKVALAKRGIAGMVLTQPTLSAWEKDRQLPSGENVAVLQALETVLGLPPSLIKKILKNAGKRSGFAPDDVYAEDVEKWAMAVCTKQGASTGRARIWMIAPNTLPAFLDTTNRLFKLWENNLVLGVHYHLLWILEEMADGEPFAKLEEHLEELCKTVAARVAHPPGSMNVYLIRRPKTVARETDHQKDDRNEADFKKICDAWTKEKCPWITWTYLKQFDYENKEDHEVYDLIENVRSQLFGRLAVYLGGEVPEAGLLLTGTSSRRGGDPSRSYRWLDEKASRELAGVIDTIEAWLAGRES